MYPLFRILYICSGGIWFSVVRFCNPATFLSSQKQGITLCMILRQNKLFKNMCVCLCVCLYVGGWVGWGGGVVWYMAIVRRHPISVWGKSWDVWCSGVDYHYLILLTNIILDNVFSPDDLWFGSDSIRALWCHMQLPFFSFNNINLYSLITPG